MNKDQKEFYGAAAILLGLVLHYYLNPWGMDIKVLRCSCIVSIGFVSADGN